jgi:hypothetical protein
LGNIHVLDIAYCRGISDVSALGNVPELHLTLCTLITDISALRNVKQTHLEDFDGTDVSGLENVERLFLSGSCPKISDISMLKKLQVLDVVGCPGIVPSQLSGLEKLKDLYFDFQMNTDITCQFAEVHSPPPMFNFIVLERLTTFKSIDMDFSATDGESTATTVSWNNLLKMTHQYAKNISQLLMNPTLTHLRSLSLLCCDDFTFFQLMTQKYPLLLYSL